MFQVNEVESEDLLSQAQVVESPKCSHLAPAPQPYLKIAF